MNIVWVDAGREDQPFDVEKLSWVLGVDRVGLNLLALNTVTGPSLNLEVVLQIVIPEQLTFSQMGYLQLLDCLCADEICWVEVWEVASSFD